MSVEQNKATLRRIFDEVWNKGDMSLVPQFIAQEFVSHGPGNREFKGPKGYEEFATGMRTALPDIHYTVDEMVGEGDAVTVRVSYSGANKGKVGDAEPTGRQVNSTTVQFWRFAGGKGVEAWLGFVSTETTTKNAAILRRYYSEILNKGNFSLWNEMVDKDYVLKDIEGNAGGKGLEAAKQGYANRRAGSSNHEFIIEELV